jgi:hypothetical protein
MVTGLRVNFEGVSYSAQGVRFAVKWVAGFVWAGAWAVIIKEMDVSNGPESRRNLAAISVLKMIALCQLRSSGSSVIGCMLVQSAGRFLLFRGIGLSLYEG